jgi:putative endonuclease
LSDSFWYVYLLRCADDTLYCGISTDVPRRVQAHNNGTGAKYTRSRGPVSLMVSCPCPDKSTALRLELRIKKMPRKNKLAALRQAARESASCLT